jgi:hypothetical protein
MCHNVSLLPVSNVALGHKGETDGGQFIGDGDGSI